MAARTFPSTSVPRHQPKLRQPSLSSTRTPPMATRSQRHRGLPCTTSPLRPDVVANCWIRSLPCLASRAPRSILPSSPASPSSGPLRSVKIRSTTLVRVLQGFVLLPSGVTSKMTIFLYVTIIIDMLVVSFLLLCLATCHLLMSTFQHCHKNPLTPPYPSKPLFGYVTVCSVLL